jgi:transcriptional regulator with XRE-family HTH domain
MVLQMRQNPPQPYELFGARVREARRIHQLSLAQVAARLHEFGRPIDKSTIARIERGELRPSVEHLVLLAAVLDVCPTDLLLPRDEAAVVGIGNKQVPARIARNWITGAAPPDAAPDERPRPLRQTLGMSDDPMAEVSRWLAMRPGLLAAAMRREGYSDDQVADLIESLPTGESPWPSGRPQPKEGADA